MVNQKMRILYPSMTEEEAINESTQKMNAYRNRKDDENDEISIYRAFTDVNFR